MPTATPTVATQQVELKPDPAVEEFLRTCQPCLSGLLQAFVQLGFVAEGDIREVAMWPKGELVYALEKWKQRGVLNDLQVEALRMAFDRLRRSIG
jgi:hypothetical protein